MKSLNRLEFVRSKKRENCRKTDESADEAIVDFKKTQNASE